MNPFIGISHDKQKNMFLCTDESEHLLCYTLGEAEIFFRDKGIKFYSFTVV